APCGRAAARRRDRTTRTTSSTSRASAAAPTWAPSRRSARTPRTPRARRCRASSGSRAPDRMSPPPAADKAAPAHGARWVDRVTAVLLAVASGAVLASAAPALLRAAGVELPSRSDPSPSSAPLALPRVPPDILGHPGSPDLITPPPSALFDPDRDV